MIFTRDENKKIVYNRLESDLLFNELLNETIQTPKELKWCIKELLESIEEAAHDWFIDHNYRDKYDNCQIELYFNNDVDNEE